jgi:glycosyltransferase involved in cell wall biosynthesis
MTRVAFAMEQTLGSVTHYLNLRSAETVLPGFAPRWLPIEFRQSRLPWAVAGSLDARRALSAALPEVDGLFLHTTTLSLASPDLYRKRPTVLSTDGTPASKDGMREAYGQRPQSALGARAKRAAYRAVFRQARGFVGWARWVADSLIEQYGCRPEEVAVIPPGIDLTAFRAGERGGGLPRILFVGGDFPRKGGDVLLSAFRERLRGKAELELVTAAKLPAEPGVRVHNGMKPNSPELRALYSSCDLFCLPTRADCLPLVCLEALAAGLPIVATNVGGIPDTAIPGKTGALVEPGSVDQLGAALLRLVDDPAERARLSANARRLAEEEFEVSVTTRRLFEFVRSRCE